MPKVLIVTPKLDGADGISEVSRQVVDVAIGMVGSASAEVWTLEDGALPGGTVPVRSARGSRLRIVAWPVLRSMRRADDLLVFAMHVHLAPLMLPLVARGARLVCFLYGVEAWRPLRRRERAALAAASRVIAISKFTVDRFREANPDCADIPVEVCPLGIRQPPRRPALPPIRDYALIVGRLSCERYKGQERLIEIWPDVVRAAPGARLVIVGDGEDALRLQAHASALGMRDHIRFVGRVTDAERDGWYRNAAFFVMPSTGEGFGLTYVEAMCAAKPCVAGKGAAEEIIEDGRTGFIVDPESAEAVRDAVIRLFQDRAARETMGRAAAATASERFLHDHFASRLQGLLAVDCA